MQRLGRSDPHLLPLQMINRLSLGISGLSTQVNTIPPLDHIQLSQHNRWNMIECVLWMTVNSSQIWGHCEVKRKVTQLQ